MVQVSANQRDASLATCTARLGFDVMGIWADDSDYTDINSVTRSAYGRSRFNQQKAAQGGDLAACVDMATEEESADGVPGCGYLVTADDMSTVRLFNYPVVWDDAPHKLFRGHSSHIMWTSFNADDRLVFTAGGRDRGIYQWRTIGISQEDRDKDKLVLACLEHLITERRDGQNAHEPKPGVEWVPLEEGGRVFGPAGHKATMEKMANPANSGTAGPQALGRTTVVQS